MDKHYNFNPTKIKGRMAERGITNIQVAKEINKSTNSVSSKILGKTPMNVTELVLIANMLKVPIEYFFDISFGDTPNNAP